MPANQSTPEVTRALKPCPFCGGIAALDDSAREEMAIVQVCCSICGGMGPFADEADHEDPGTAAIAAWNTRTPARGGDELREALHSAIHRARHEWVCTHGVNGKGVDDAICDAVMAALASTDMAGAGEKTREALTATKAMYQDEIALLRKTLIAMGRMIPGVALHDDVSSSFLALLPTELAAAFAAPPVEGLTSGEGWQSIETAPKDGSWFIADGGGLDRPTPMKWCARVGAWEADAVMLEDWDQQAEGYSRPLFWLAIPSRTASPKATATASVRECYRHVKRGTVYEVQGLAELQTADGALVDGSSLVIYKGEDGKLWAREEGEFHDGRFALTDSGTAATIGGERARCEHGVRHPWQCHDCDAANPPPPGYDPLTGEGLS